MTEWENATSKWIIDTDRHKRKAIKRASTQKAKAVIISISISTEEGLTLQTQKGKAFNQSFDNHNQNNSLTLSQNTIA